MKSQSHPEPVWRNRRSFIKTTSIACGAVGLATGALRDVWGAEGSSPKAAPMAATDLPQGAAPAPVALPHFPDRLHAFVWRNWPLVPLERMAEVVGARRSELLRLGKSMGLAGPPRITPAQQRRSALTVIRRNWQLLPYAQLLQLLGWTAEQMAFSLREDDFLYVKLGNLKPRCEALKYQPPDAGAAARAAEMARIVRTEFTTGAGEPEEPLFDFVPRLSKPIARPRSFDASAFTPRYCYSYFALYGDPLLEPDLDPYPEGYLARLAESGVNGVWLQGMLSRLAPFPWNADMSRQFEARLGNLSLLVERAQRHGIRVWLYLNEPRALPVGFFNTRPGLKGVTEGDYAALCTEVPEVRDYLVSAVASICRAVPGLGGFFTITGSENLTHCWSHQGGTGCPRCRQRPPAEIVAALNGAFYEGIRQAGQRQELIVWDWGWPDAWVDGIIDRLPREVMFMGVSEWSMPIRRGGVETTVGEYSISTVGPGERARRHWERARQRGLRTVAKVQCGNTWELSAVPYIPALANVARHAANLRRAGVNGLMLGWTLGGYPSPNLEVVAEVGAAAGPGEVDTLAVLARVAERRYGKEMAPAVVRAWQQFSDAFSEFPFHGGLVYNAPLQLGPANPLWGDPSGYHATMVGFPYDDLDAWRAVYPAEVFIGQFEKVADGFERACAGLQTAFDTAHGRLSRENQAAMLGELRVAEASGMHFRATANQARFVLARRRLADAKSPAEAQAAASELESLLKAEISLARRLHAIQSRDSRIGFEASNQYYYVPVDLVEKVLNCHDLLERWLPVQLAKKK